MNLNQILSRLATVPSIVAIVWIGCGHSQLQANEVERWGIHEIWLDGTAEGNPFVDVRLTATFECDDQKIVVPGFYDGDGKYCIRFSPPTAGAWRYTTQSSQRELHQQSGQFNASAARLPNRGPIVVDRRFHFAYADGTPFYPIGTTCYAWTHQSDDLIEQTLNSLKASPFNKVRMCVFPKNYAFNQGESLRFPFQGTLPNQWDTTRFNPSFFKHLERCVERLMHLGIEADLILFHPYDQGRWGFDRMSDEADDRYLRYMIARFSAYRNVWWSLANEFDFMKEKQTDDWDRLISLLAVEDPHHRLRSIHNGKELYNQTRAELTHASIQNGSAVADFGRAILFRDIYSKPIVFDEVKYEGDIEQRWGRLSAQEMVHRFWQATIAGTYATHGETYQHPENILWWAKGGTLHGQSPDRIAFLKRLLTECPTGMEPIDKWQNDRTFGIKGQIYWVYFGKEQPTEWDVSLPRDGHEGPMRMTAQWVDTWNMSVTPIPGVFEFQPEGKYLYRCPSRPKLEMPGKPFMLLCLKASDRLEPEFTDDPMYRDIAIERAGKIVQALPFSDPKLVERVQQIIAEQYIQLHSIHGLRDDTIAKAKQQYVGDKAWIQNATNAAQAAAETSQFKLHYQFLARLSADLPPDQIERIKDAMTYHVAPKTLKAFQELYPELNDEQIRQIRSWLHEAREYAMDAGSSEEKHAWFGKYKGRINNYLSQAGFNAKEAEKNLRARQQ